MVKRTNTGLAHGGGRGSGSGIDYVQDTDPSLGGGWVEKDGVTWVQTGSAFSVYPFWVRQSAAWLQVQAGDILDAHGYTEMAVIDPVSGTQLGVVGVGVSSSLLQHKLADTSKEATVEVSDDTVRLILESPALTTFSATLLRSNRGLVFDPANFSIVFDALNAAPTTPPITPFGIAGGVVNNNPALWIGGSSKAWVGLLSGEPDPSASSGVAAPLASLYMRQNGGTTGELWCKTGTTDTSWTKITP